MHILRIEHPVMNYEAWKAAFDGDPIGRERSGVRRHRVMRAADNAHYVLIDLEFDDLDAANAAHDALRELWANVDVIQDPRARAVEVVEERSY